MTTHLRFTIDSDVTPAFTACYLRIAGDECAFVEAHTAHARPRLLAALSANGKRPEDVRWVIVTHAHLDHAAGASALLAACPNATLVAHPRAAKHLIQPERLVKSATAVYGEARFKELYGQIDPIDAARVKTLGDGEGIDFADARFTVFHTEGHANHHFIVQDSALDAVFTGDTFGLVYPRLQAFGRFALPSTSPTGFDAALAHKSIDKVLTLGASEVCLTHYDGYKDALVIAAQLHRFIDRAGRWVEEAVSTEEDTAALEARFSVSWKAAIAEEAPRFGAEELAFLALDIELNAGGLAYAAVSKRGKRPSARA